MVELYAFFEAYAKSKSHEFKPLELSVDRSRNLSLIQGFFDDKQRYLSQVKTESLIEKSREKYDSHFENEFCYEFTEGDLNRIQQLINELRDNIQSSDLFTSDHKRRLLKRLERLQKELHKKVSDLDRFWGLVGDAGVVLGKFGNDAQPFVQRIKEIADIVWRTQSIGEELPSGTETPFLKEENGS